MLAPAICYLSADVFKDLKQKCVDCILLEFWEIPTFKGNTTETTHLPYDETVHEGNTGLWEPIIEAIKKSIKHGT